jgi:hypothetical protein
LNFAVRAGKELDVSTGGAWVPDGLRNLLAREPDHRVVVLDSVRRSEQIERSFPARESSLGPRAVPRRRGALGLIGGQFGSEGRVMCARFLAREYSVLVRVGGPKA